MPLRGLKGAKATMRLFFDRAAVINAVSKGRRRALSKVGAFVRRTARSLIRSRRRASNPGEPPSSHEGSLRRLLFFAYDQSADSVVIGPALMNGASRHVFTHGKTVPETLEFGGQVTAMEYLAPLGPTKKQKWVWVRSHKAKSISVRQRKRTSRIEPRPFMRPAFEMNRRAVVQMFRNCVRG